MYLSWDHIWSGLLKWTPLEDQRWEWGYQISMWTCAMDNHRLWPWLQLQVWSDHPWVFDHLQYPNTGNFPLTFAAILGSSAIWWSQVTRKRDWTRLADHEWLHSALLWVSHTLVIRVKWERTILLLNYNARQVNRQLYRTVSRQDLRLHYTFDFGC